jgi:hypothetical protein
MSISCCISGSFKSWKQNGAGSAKGRASERGDGVTGAKSPKRNYKIVSDRKTGNKSAISRYFWQQPQLAREADGLPVHSSTGGN